MEPRKCKIFGEGSEKEKWIWRANRSLWDVYYIKNINFFDGWMRWRTLGLTWPDLERCPRSRSFGIGFCLLRTRKVPSLVNNFVFLNIYINHCKARPWLTSTNFLETNTIFFHAHFRGSVRWQQWQLRHSSSNNNNGLEVGWSALKQDWFSSSFQFNWRFNLLIRRQR